MKLSLTDQFNYVNKVVLTCKTKEQLSNAHKWAWEWSKKAKSNYPNIIHSHTDLFLDVIREWKIININHKITIKNENTKTNKG